MYGALWWDACEDHVVSIRLGALASSSRKESSYLLHAEISAVRKSFGKCFSATVDIFSGCRFKHTGFFCVLRLQNSFKPASQKCIYLLSKVKLGYIS